jgi:hypothetical protein
MNVKSRGALHGIVQQFLVGVGDDELKRRRLGLCLPATHAQFHASSSISGKLKSVPTKTSDTSAPPRTTPLASAGTRPGPLSAAATAEVVHRWRDASCRLVPNRRDKLVLARRASEWAELDVRLALLNTQTVQRRGTSRQGEEQLCEQRSVQDLVSRAAGWRMTLARFAGSTTSGEVHGGARLPRRGLRSEGAHVPRSSRRPPRQLEGRVHADLRDRA